MYGQARDVASDVRGLRVTLLLHLRKCCEIPSRLALHIRFCRAWPRMAVRHMHRPF